MKTRLLFIPYQLFFFNPYNGFDVEIDEAKARDYLRLVKQLDELNTEIAEELMPQARVVDDQLEAFFKRNGLRCLVQLGEDGVHSKDGDHS